MKAEAGRLGDILPEAGVMLALSEGGSTLREITEAASKKAEEESRNDTVSGDSWSGVSFSSAANQRLDELRSGESRGSSVSVNSRNDSSKSENSSEEEEYDPYDSTDIVDTMVIPKSDPDAEEMMEEIEEEALSPEDQAEKEAKEEEEYFKNLVIAQVSNYVNVRSDAGEENEVVGKLYNNSVGELISEKDGWFEIKSGNCTGYVKGEFCVTGEAAVELARKVGTRIAKVTTTTLFVRQEPTTESPVIGMVPIEDELVVDEELEGWVRVNVEEGDGYVSRDYVTLSTEFVTAESKKEEEARLAKEKAAREAARKAAQATQERRQRESSVNNNKSETALAKAQEGKQVVAASSGSGTGKAVANYALQFVGNPYVYGGSSLTNGTDCSGFVMSVYKNFGVSLPHSSSADRSQGSAVSSLAEAQPGDILCYSGHVGIYIGGGQIVHASTPSSGIKVSDASYRKILSIRRIF
ncbi:MAG: C40 family peptidase [Lachnospiraceae bacterium]|nr:C40 family peptidase [Lachnospiraceae bacterium]